nr:uncharacterized protein I203_08038 [Kwoniella mangroviensis CBS 8507]OCF62904.1 hypothetical protein I203_08038 [Kwoniella mangroviensis CBS 8507]
MPQETRPKEENASSEDIPPRPPTLATEQGSSAPTDSKEIKEQAEKLVGEGKKAIALKQWEEGVNKYGEALDLMRQLVGDFDPVMAPLLLSYGKALYELAFSQQGVMGKEEGSKEADEAVRQGTLEEAPSKNGNFVFSADPSSDNEEENQDAGPSTSAQPDEGEGEAEDEPEDDYNAAWEVLDVARTIYQKIVEGKSDGEEGVKEDKLNLADCYLALGDVSCETENFPQAVQDYTSALSIQSTLLPPSSRILASTHYQLATVLEFTPNKQTEALSYVEKALDGFKLRLSELKSTADEKVSEEVKKLNDKEKEKEIKDVENLIEDLNVKIEELKTTSVNETNDLISQSINHLLGQPESDQFGDSSSTSKDTGPVNDLTSMVKKKKPKTTNVPKNVEEVKQAVNEMVNNAKPLVEQTNQSVVEPALEKGKEVVDLAERKLGEVVSSVGEGLLASGEGLKRDNDGEEEEGRKSKKAKTE